MANLEFEINGTTPLLVHADNIDGADQLDQWRKNPQNKGLSRAGDDRSPAWTWLTYLYVDDDRRLAIPQENIMAALVRAGSYVSIGRNKTLKRSASSGLHIPQERLPLLVNGKPVDTTPFSEAMLSATFDQYKGMAAAVGIELWSKRAKIGQAKHVRVRPKIKKWSIVGRLDIRLPEFTEDVVRELFAIAGRRVGLGDWRPDSPKSPGPYGQFTATVRKAK